MKYSIFAEKGGNYTSKISTIVDNNNIANELGRGNYTSKISTIVDNKSIT